MGDWKYAAVTLLPDTLSTTSLCTPWQASSILPICLRHTFGSLQVHLVEAHKQAARLVRKEAELSSALAEFGVAAEQLVRQCLSLAFACLSLHPTPLLILVSFVAQLELTWSLSQAEEAAAQLSSTFVECLTDQWGRALYIRT